MKKKNSYLILSGKSWNSSLSERLKKQFPDCQWHHIKKKEDFIKSKVDKLSPEKIFIPHWSYIIKEEIYNNYECIVFHMTDLPFGRGGSPLQNLITRGIYKTKISALKVTGEIDAGPIYLKENLDLNGNAQEIFVKADEIIESMIKLIIINKISPNMQVGKPSYFKRRTPIIIKINNEIKNYINLYDHIRMLDAEGYPKAYFETDFFKFEFSNAQYQSDKIILSNVRIIKK